MALVGDKGDFQDLKAFEFKNGQAWDEQPSDYIHIVMNDVRKFPCDSYSMSPFVKLFQIIVEDLQYQMKYPVLK